MEEDCVFCKIVEGKIPSTNASQDHAVSELNDINSIAPTHISIIHNQHKKTLSCSSFLFILYIFDISKSPSN